MGHTYEFSLTVDRLSGTKTIDKNIKVVWGKENTSNKTYSYTVDSYIGTGINPQEYSFYISRIGLGGGNSATEGGTQLTYTSFPNSQDSDKDYWGAYYYYITVSGSGSGSSAKFNILVPTNKIVGVTHNQYVYYKSYTRPKVDGE